MPPIPSLIAFCDATIFTGDSMTEGHALLAANGKITDIVSQSRIPANAARINCSGQILAPGFIDVQVNGGGNILFNNAPTPESANAIAEAHKRYGTTRLLLTCITDSIDVTKQAIVASRAARKNDLSILGIHIEGPHLSVERRGVHKAEKIRAITGDDLSLYRRDGDETMLMTLAPENASPEQIATLRNQGVIISIGHTGAMPEQIRAALAAGATGFTHLFNGMGGLSARDPGPAGIALDDRTSWCSLIADGHHLSDEIIRLALRAKPEGKVFLVSDAMPPAATDAPESFQLYGETIRTEGGRCINSEGKLAGAAITMLDAVRHCVTKVRIELEETLRMASAYPAAFLGLDKRFGFLLPGYEADIVALDSDLILKGVWTAGTTISVKKA